MSKHRVVLSGSTALLLALTTGCTLPTTAKKGAEAGPATDNIIAGANLAGAGSVGMPAAGLISNNSGGLTGTVRGPSASLIANNAAGLISNNSGGLISNNSGGLISNNSGGLISNNSGGLISNNAGSYHVQATTQLVAVPKAVVKVFDAAGKQLDTEAITTNERGFYTVKKLKDSTPLLFVTAEYEVDGRKISITAATMAPRKMDKQVELNPVTTMVGKKLRDMVESRAVAANTIKQETIDQMVAAVNEKMSERAAVAAAIFDDNQAALTFDNMLTESADLRNALQKVITANSAGNVIAKSKPAPSGLPTNNNQPQTGTGSQTGTGTGAGTDSGTQAGTDTDTGTGTDSETAAPPAATPTATVFTLGKAASATSVAFQGDKVYAIGADSLHSAPLSSLTAAVTFTADAANKGKAVTFDGADRYVLTGTTIIKPDGKPVTLNGVPSGVDFVVTGGFAYVVSSSQDAIYKVDLTTGDGTVFAGQPSKAGYANGNGATAQFSDPSGITLSGGSLYVADAANRCVRKVTLAGDVTLFAGSNGKIGANDGAPSNGQFSSPVDVAADGAGNLYVVDTGNNNIRKVSADGTITTIAGNRTNDTKDGTGEAASFSFPTSIAVGKVGAETVLIVGEAGTDIRLVSKW